MLIALLLDLATIAGGLLLAVPLLRRLPVVGYDLGRFAGRATPWGWVVGIVALVTGGYYLIVHVVSGPRLFPFELVGIGVGLALTWSRLTGRGKPAGDEPAEPSGRVLLLAVFGLIAVVFGVQGLFTPDG